MKNEMINLERCDVLWAVRRLPAKIVEQLKGNPKRLVLAGGYIRSCVAGEKVNDIDLFADSAEFSELVARRLETGSDKVKKTDNAFNIRVGRDFVQFIHRWTYTSPQELILSFDFTVASAAIWYEDDEWKGLCCSSFYSDLAGKRLVYTSPSRNEDAGGSMLRVLKFYQRGYRIPLDSLGAVVARLVGDIREDSLPGVKCSGPWSREKAMASVVTGLLREVDPNIDPDHIAHLPAAEEAKPEIVAAQCDGTQTGDVK